MAIVSHYPKCAYLVLPLIAGSATHYRSTNCDSQMSVVVSQPESAQQSPINGGQYHDAQELLKSPVSNGRPTPISSREIKHIHPANSPLQQELEQLAASWMQRGNLPGVWLAVVNNGVTVGAIASGMSRDSGGKYVRASLEDRINVGSVSKPLVALMVNRAIERGLITWRTRIVDVFPNLDKSVYGPCRFANIAQLVTHTSGLPLRNERPVQVPVGTDGVNYRVQVVEQSLLSKPVGQPGEKVFYSNVGLTIATSMLEKLTNKSFGTLMEEMVYTPLGMSSVGMMEYSGGKFIGIEPHYIMEDGRISAGSLGGNSFLQYSPTGGISGRILDFAKFVAFMATFHDGVVSRSIWERLYQKPPNVSVTYGAWSGDPNKWLTHGGSTGRGERCIVWVGAKPGNGYIFYTNANSKDGGSAAGDNLTNMITSDMQRVLQRMLR